MNVFVSAHINLAITFGHIFLTKCPEGKHWTVIRSLILQMIHEPALPRILWVYDTNIILPSAKLCIPHAQEFLEMLPLLS